MFDGISGANLIGKEKGRLEISAAIPVSRLAIRSQPTVRMGGGILTAPGDTPRAAIDETGAVAE